MWAALSLGSTTLQFRWSPCYGRCDQGGKQAACMDATKSDLESLDSFPYINNQKYRRMALLNKIHEDILCLKAEVQIREDFLILKEEHKVIEQRLESIEKSLSYLLPIGPRKDDDTF